ncbi:hypothetical protein CMQ_7054 [Grosmannia clavigera kw1407]|uniref:Dihydroflavonal-4-reductase protein n=1 Tax=Grosmannia clavigera (strain kw1407 / UAMH 11150) TaxID=655863 RepID=F0XQ30_GROCL|nr:uncharacterized protein CMQ_7054 [Grosmannia clavigera kw1407]EFX00052.1 hypothetical protein CMQ_7054 [Grosmannia clavigera kw1407]
MLQAQSSSAGGILPMPQGQHGQQYPASPQRQSFYGSSNGVSGTQMVYRTTPAPIQPYAFTSTPSLHTNMPRQQPQQQIPQPTTMRTPSVAPCLPQLQSFDSSINLGRTVQQPASASMSNLSTSSTVSGGRYTFGSRDDSSLPTSQGTKRVAASQTSAAYPPGTQSFAQAASARASPERYRRAMPRTVTSPAVSVQGQQQKPASAAPSGSGMASIGHLYGSSVSSGLSQQQLNSNRRNSCHDAALTTVDDMQLYRPSDDAKRIRRRSMPSLDLTHHAPSQGQFRKPEPSPRSHGKDKQRAASGGNLSPGSAIMRNKDGSSESVSSRGSSARPANKDSSKHVHIPQRGSSSDAANRAAASVSQSRPKAMDVAADGDKRKVAANMTSNRGAKDDAGSTADQKAAKGNPNLLESPAMRHLSAINQKGGKVRSKTSRLRRAFSFGSAADFRTAGPEDEDSRDIVAPLAPSRLHTAPGSDEIYDAEQDRIAQRQEEAGIGSSIYAGARIFTGSTDNLSISSTASSASIMIRKMGRNMKKGTRSFVGLFRPKSIIGAPAAESGVAGSGKSGTANTAEATVSMVTAEADRERGTANSGGSGYPKLQRSSVDASVGSATSDRLSSSGTDNSGRKSIVGGERERAEVLAAVRKGILKHASGSRSPSRGPAEDRSLDLELPGPLPINDSPASSAPSTPNDESLGHKRTGSVAIGGEDYFVSALRLRQGSRSGNSTPQGSMRRNATFSPRIVFYDTWPSQEYDRRGEVATCNRLTPMLAQQIKEELNSFKMEMEVHENSKIYTHFF